jgi:SagB-type dehydrogenase family enzyme
VTDFPPSTVSVAGAIHGGKLDAADPAELLHEASRLHPALLGRQMLGVARLERDPALQLTTSRAVRRNPALPRTSLRRLQLPDVSLRDALAKRRSVRRFSNRPITVDQLATVLAWGYGVVPGSQEQPPRRPSPSAGALYPLELFVLAPHVAGLGAQVLHYDPLAHELEQLCVKLDVSELSPLTDEIETAAAIVVIAAVFWRSRFKYGLRAYRFTLLEAGHVAQNMLLAATSLGLGSIVVGGFYDARVDALLGLNGVDESSLIMLSLGWSPG